MFFGPRWSQIMGFQWTPVSAEECNAFGQASGQCSVILNGVPWLRIRPLFYRPLLPFQAFAPGANRPPAGAVLGAFQHAVPSIQNSNSLLNLLMFSDAGDYSMATLDYNRRRQIKIAGKAFEVRPFTDPAEFKEKAHPVYLSFLERTKYEHASHRRERGRFCDWADCLFRMPKIAILGAFRSGSDTLGAVSLSFVFEQTLVYASFFCDTDSMKHHISDGMLHFVRESAAGQGLKRVFVGMRKTGGHASVDEFYLTRGCQVLGQPAYLHVNALAKVFLMVCMPRVYQRLCGGVRVKDRPSDNDTDHPSPHALGTAGSKPPPGTAAIPVNRLGV
jgi:hypothetical protein